MAEALVLVTQFSWSLSCPKAVSSSRHKTAAVSSRLN